MKYGQLTGLKLLKTTLLLLLAACFALPSIALPQEEPPTAAEPPALAGVPYVVPLMAADENGNPVEDLKKEELTVFFDSAGTDFVLVPPGAPPRQAANVEVPKTVHVIILDATINGQVDFAASKRLADTWIAKLPDNQPVVVLQYTPYDGLQISIPLTHNKKHLQELMVKLMMYCRLEHNDARKKTSRSDHMRWDNERWNRYFYTSYNHSRTFFKKLESEYRKDLYREDQTLRFSYLRSKLSESLEYLGQPSVVVLFSRGISNQNDLLGEKKKKQKPYTGFARKEYSDFFIHQMGLLEKSIPESGAMLLSVNPKTTSKKKIALVAGRCYRLLIPNGQTLDHKGSLRVFCRRPGVTITTPRGATPHKPYTYLSNAEKRSFLTDIVTEEPWSDFASKIAFAKFKKLYGAPEDTPANPNVESYRIDLPSVFFFRELDVFTITVNPQNGAMKVSYIPMEVKDELIIPIKKSDHLHRYFAVVEPINFYCLYNRVDTLPAPLVRKSASR